MPFRDDLEHAHRRIEQLEEELEEERKQNAPQPEPVIEPVPAAAPVREEQKSVERPQTREASLHAISRLARRTGEAALQWWPAIVAVLTAITYVAAFGLSLPDAAFTETFERVPWHYVQWAVLSTFVGSVLYTLDVALRARSAKGERTMFGRILLILAVVAGAPALLALFVLAAEALSIAVPAVMAVVGLGALIRWIRTGKTPDTTKDEDPPTDVSTD